MHKYWKFFVFYANKLNSNRLKFSVGRKQEEEKDTKIYYVHSNTSGLVSEYMHYFNDFPNKKYSSKYESFGVLNKPDQNLNESKSLHSYLFTIIKLSFLFILKKRYFDTNNNVFCISWENTIIIKICWKFKIKYNVKYG